LQIAFNGTVFNNKTGYRVLPVALPLQMPFHSSDINSTWQLFVSTYVMEHFSNTLLTAKPYNFYMTWDYLNDPMLEFTTTTLEAYFPQMQLYHGRNIPVDMNFLLLNASDFISSKETMSLSFNLNMSCQALMHNDNGTTT